MKFYTFVLVACAFIATTKCLLATDREDKMKIHNVCVAETGVSQEFIDKMIAGEFCDDTNFKNYLVCFLKNDGVFLDNGELKADGANRQIREFADDEDTVSGFMANCAVQMATVEESAFHYSKCMYNTLYG
uniref:Odorant binding protein 19 n=1 Tax=Colaphellus bowringi TaxID=561076 RepID=A0A0S3J392_9CUCU|nr:odorant binding protein 19 [Colaphellus bowringi]